MPDPLYLLDTNIILQLVRGSDFGQYVADSFGLMDVVHRPMVSVVTHGELLVLADSNKWGERRLRTLQNALNNLVIVDLNDESILSAYVDVSRACRQHPRGARVLSSNDLWIAATARAAGARLITTDKDFLPLHPQECFVHYVDQEAFSSGSSEGNGAASQETLN